jgi:hypothetical protein
MAPPSVNLILAIVAPGSFGTSPRSTGAAPLTLRPPGQVMSLATLSTVRVVSVYQRMFHLDIVQIR